MSDFNLAAWNVKQIQRSVICERFIIPEVYGERELTKHHSGQSPAYAQAQQTKVVVGMTLLLTFNCSVK